MSNQRRTLVIAGMHRSGTSLLASLAAEAGVDMGLRLMPAGKGNPRGHFEDLDFVRFHDACLARRGASALRPPAAAVDAWSGGEEGEARALVAAREGSPLWGWKDPRSALFLAAWDALLPAPFYLLVYRHPVEVALSLLRRGLDLEVQLDPATAMRAWISYNRCLLAWRARCGARSLLWSVAAATGDLPPALDQLAEKSGLAALAGHGLAPVFAHGELHRGLRATGIDWRAILPEAMALHDELERAADLSAGDGGGDRAAGAGDSRERDLEETNEHLLAAVLAGAPRNAEVAVAARERIDFSELRRLMARQAKQIEQRDELVAKLTVQRDRLSQERAQIESTRSWRLTHSLWGVARRWQGWRRQQAWRARRLAGALPAIAPDDIVVGCVAENQPRFLAQARRLVASLRWFGGRLAGARFLVCVVGGVGAADRAALEQAGAEVRVVAAFDPRNPPANKLQFFAPALATGAGALLLLDCDTVVVDDPVPLLVPGALQAKIADLPSVTHEAFRRLFAYYGLALPRRRYRTTLNGVRTILYCNSGVVFMPSGLAQELVPVWSEWNVRILDSLDLLGPCAHHCHQASLSLALAAHPVPFAAAPVELNLPLHMHPQPAPAVLMAAAPAILHYHDEVDAGGCLLPTRYPRSQARIEALNLKLRAAGLGAEDPRSATMPR